VWALYIAINDSIAKRKAALLKVAKVAALYEMGTTVRNGYLDQPIELCPLTSRRNSSNKAYDLHEIFGDLPLSGRHPLTGLARTVWRPDQDTHALLALVQERRVEEAV